MISKFVPPAFDESGFTCPHCGAYCSQQWCNVSITFPDTDIHTDVDLEVAICFGCGQPTLWHDERLVYPSDSSAPPPHPDLPDELKEDYLEARDIVTRSPRGAAALMRLLIEKLVKHLGGTGGDLNAGIASLVRSRKIDERVQKALDSVRVIGGESVHPGTLDVRDSPELANSLFSLVNVIVQEAITKDKEIDAIYAMLPDTKLAAIEKRDGRASVMPNGETAVRDEQFCSSNWLRERSGQRFRRVPALTCS